MSCRCLARVTRSSTRTRLKLAGTTDKAKATQTETSTSTEEAFLWAGSHARLRGPLPTADPAGPHAGPLGASAA